MLAGLKVFHHYKRLDVLEKWFAQAFYCVDDEAVSLSRYRKHTHMGCKLILIGLRASLKKKIKKPQSLFTQNWMQSVTEDGVGRSPGPLTPILYPPRRTQEISNIGKSTLFLLINKSFRNKIPNNFTFLSFSFYLDREPYNIHHYAHR